MLTPESMGLLLQDYPLHRRRRPVRRQLPRTQRREPPAGPVHPPRHAGVALRLRDALHRAVPECDPLAPPRMWSTSSAARASMRRCCCRLTGGSWARPACRFRSTGANAATAWACTGASRTCRAGALSGTCSSTRTTGRASSTPVWRCRWATGDVCRSSAAPRRPIGSWPSTPLPNAA